MQIIAKNSSDSILQVLSPTAVKMPLPGDLDGDGIITVLDFVRFKKLFASGEIVNAPLGDIDQNGVCDSNDLVMLRKILLDIV